LMSFISMKKVVIQIKLSSLIYPHRELFQLDIQKMYGNQYAVRSVFMNINIKNVIWNCNNTCNETYLIGKPRSWTYRYAINAS
jgi:hypothetical protein